VKRRLRRRLTLTHAVVALLAIAVMATTIYVAGDRRFASYVDEVQGARSEAVVQALADAYKAPDGWDASAIYALSRVAMLSNVDVAVYSTEGQLVFTLQGRRTAGTTDVARDQFEVQSHPVIVDGKRVASAEIYTPRDIGTAADEAYRSALTRNVIAAAVIALLLSLLVGLIVSLRATAPLVELTDAAREVAQGNLDVRVTSHSEDEIGVLAGAFNEMAGRLAQDEQVRRDMTADLSGELRTPLDAMRSRIAALQDGALPPTREDLRAIGAEVERLERLLGALHDLNELESDDLDIELEELDLAEVAREAAVAATAAFAAKGVALTTELSHAAVRADRQRVARIAANLLDNALKFTPADGQVVLAVANDSDPPEAATSGGAWATLRVSDNGRGIDPADLPFVFDRFYRAPSARDTQGVGLGLAIVRGLAEASGGTAVADNGSGGGTVVTVHLPRAR
jgi:two-component system, OmpR family, sensor histidine kinase BaeS